MAKNPIRTKIKEKTYIALTKENFATSIAQYGNDFDHENILQQSRGSVVGRTFEDYDGSISVKSSITRRDYEWFRVSESIPTQPKEIMRTCDKAYQRVGIIKNIIDLMSEFATSGIRLQHTDKKIEAFYNAWFKQVQGKDRSERFINLLYRIGNVVVKRYLGVLGAQDKRQWRQGKAKKINEVQLDVTKTYKNQIPLKYTFLPPMNLDIVNADIATITNEREYILALKNDITISNLSVVPRGPRRLDTRHVDKLPDDIREAYKRGEKFAKLDNSRLRSFFYKRDDWQLWANPMIYSILEDLIMYSKLKLADIASLDGVISNVRLWTLGVINDTNPMYSILPTKAGINRVKSLLHNSVGGGTIDLVWGPELTFKESSTEAWRWLGSQKYGPTLDAIYDGLGIPPSLRSSDGSTNTGNYIGLQTLIERLEYGRDILLDFWYGEIKLVHDAMGFKTSMPKVVFDEMVLADRAAERQLLIHLADRDIISYETINEAFGYHPEVENARVKREVSKRGKQIPYKASPFHTPEKEHEYKKLFIQGGTVTPSEIGLSVLPKNKGELNRLEYMSKLKPNGGKEDKTNLPGNSGRPKNVTETQKRKPKAKEKPSTNAELVNLVIWANSVQDDISKILTPAILKTFNKKNMRSLSSAEYKEYERLKFIVLCNLKPYEVLTDEKVKNILNNKSQENAEIKGMVKLFKKQFWTANNRKPKLEELRQINASAYSFYYKD